MDAIVLDTDVCGQRGWFCSLVAVAANSPRNAELNLCGNLAGLLRESAVLSRTSSC